MPRKFEFRLEPLLDWRKRVEAEKQRDFAACRRALEDCTQEIARLDDARRRCGTMLAANAGVRPASELRLRDAHLRVLEAAIAHERRTRAELEAACRRAHDELVAASRERRVIEKLKERRRQSFDAEEARREELAIDEANARASERRMRGPHGAEPKMRLRDRVNAFKWPAGDAELRLDRGDRAER
jgi:flagellar FliJ protein